MTDVVVLVPMLTRPHRVAPLLESIRATSDARVLFICSPGDIAVHEAIDAASAERIEVDGPHPGDYARKINAGYRHTTEKHLMLGADDLLFHPGWYEAAVAQLTDGIGVVGTNDLGSPRVIAGEHATHSLVTRDYCDRFGTIDGPGAVLCEVYPHEFVDDEFVETAKHRNAWAFAFDSHVEHLHPNWGKAPSDRMYEQQRTRMRAGRRMYNDRKRLWADPYDVTICVGTFGDDSWIELAEARALPSARQFAVPVVHVHADTLHDARNGALAQVETEWVVFLDADDELDPGYLDHLFAATADVRGPAVKYLQQHRATPAKVQRVAGHRHTCSADCLPQGNWLVVGSMVRAQMVRDVGGWRDFPWSEDWDLWLRCHLAGATFEPVPAAVYRAHVRPDSRNRAPEHEAKMAAHRAIYEANFGVPA